MAGFELTIRATPKGFRSIALENAIRNYGKLPNELAKIGRIVTAEIKRNLSGRILKRRSSDLYNSWDWAITAQNRGWRLAIGSDVVYARIHNFGGFTGRGHRTKIRKTRYVDKAVIAKKEQIRRLMRDYVTTITR